jgi:RNA polymerase sigma factor (sigma-70 family)
MDEHELRAQLEQHHESSYGWALHCCGHRTTEAEEVLQTTYVKVLDGRARFDGRASFKTWLFAVIRHTAADERRRQWLRMAGLVRYMRLQPRQEHQEPAEAHIQRSQQQVAFREALACLPERQQQVLHLVFYQDMTVQQAAEAMGVSVGSARQHYERGKKRLRQCLNLGEEEAHEN